MVKLLWSVISLPRSQVKERRSFLLPHRSPDRSLSQSPTFRSQPGSIHLALMTNSATARFFSVNPSRRSRSAAVNCHKPRGSGSCSPLPSILASNATSSLTGTWARPRSPLRPRHDLFQLDRDVVWQFVVLAEKYPVGAHSGDFVSDSKGYSFADRFPVFHMIVRAFRDTKKFGEFLGFVVPHVGAQGPHSLC